MLKRRTNGHQQVTHERKKSFMSKREKAIRRELSNKESGKRSYGVGGKSYLKLELLEEYGLKFYTAKKNDNYIAILPPPDEESYWGQLVYVHFRIGVNRSSFLCPVRNGIKGGRCPICEEHKNLVDGGEEDADILRPYRITPRVLYYVLDMESESTMMEGTKLFTAPITLDNNILELVRNKRRSGEPDIIDISHPEFGKNVIFTKKGEGLRTEYLGVKLEDRDEPIPEEFYKGLPDFKELLYYADYDEILEEFRGYGNEEDESLENESFDSEEPEISNDEEDVVEEDFTDEEETEEESPIRKKFRERKKNLLDRKSR